MLRLYTAFVGVALLVLGAGGLLGIWDLTPTEAHLYAEDILYVGTGFIFSYIGLRREMSTTDIRTMVVGLGVLYILAGGGVAVSLALLGLFSGPYEVAYHLGQAAFGCLNAVAGWVLSRDNEHLPS